MEESQTHISCHPLKTFLNNFLAINEMSTTKNSVFDKKISVPTSNCTAPDYICSTAHIHTLKKKVFNNFKGKAY